MDPIFPTETSSNQSRFNSLRTNIRKKDRLPSEKQHGKENLPIEQPHHSATPTTQHSVTLQSNRKRRFFHEPQDWNISKNIAERITNSLARLLECGDKGCTATSLVKGILFITANSLNKSTVNTSILRIMQSTFRFFSEFAASPNTARMDQRTFEVFSDICVHTIEGDHAGQIRLNTNTIMLASKIILDSARLQKGSTNRWLERSVRDLAVTLNTTKVNNMASGLYCLGRIHFLAQDFVKLLSFLTNPEHKETELYKALTGQELSMKEASSHAALGIRTGFTILLCGEREVHAESKLGYFLVENKILQNAACGTPPQQTSFYIATSKLCCYDCAKFLKTILLKEVQDISISIHGSHGLSFANWKSPSPSYVNEPKTKLAKTELQESQDTVKVHQQVQSDDSGPDEELSEQEKCAMNIQAIRTSLSKSNDLAPSMIASLEKLLEQAKSFTAHTRQKVAEDLPDGIEELRTQMQGDTAYRDQLNKATALNIKISPAENEQFTPNSNSVILLDEGQTKSHKTIADWMRVGFLNATSIIAIERQQSGAKGCMNDVITLAIAIKIGLHVPDELQKSPIYHDALLYNNADKVGINVVGIDCPEHDVDHAQSNKFLTAAINYLSSKYTVIAIVSKDRGIKI